jgi:DNA-binding Xre family transcriptional regulator
MSDGTLKKTGWELAVLMAVRRIRSAAELARRLQTVGHNITSIHLSRIIHDRPQRLSMELLDALLTVLDCTPNELMPVHEVPSLEQEMAKARTAIKARLEEDDDIPDAMLIPPPPKGSKK